MKALAITCGVVFVIALLAVAGGIGYMIYQGIQLDSSARDYAQANIPPILSSWSKDELMKRASPELRDEIAKDPPVLDNLFKKCATLGALESQEIVKHDVHASVTTEEGKVISATCVFDAKSQERKRQNRRAIDRARRPMANPELPRRLRQLCSSEVSLATAAVESEHVEAR